MVLSKPDGQGQMFQYVQMEYLVPQDHLLRKIRSMLDLGAIYKATEGYYSADMGRPSVDPTVVCRMIYAMHVRNRERPPQLARAKTRIERTFAEGKECHCLRRAKGIRLEMMNIQALMTATV